MIEAKLYRSRLCPDQWTPGKLEILDTSFCTLELPWKNNEKKISCVPEGVYICKRQTSSKNHEWGEAFVLQGTLPRTDIQIHAANWPHEIKGCIGLGLYFYDDGTGVGQSCRAINKFMNLLYSEEEFELDIINPRGM
jgi:hypothetical protein